MRKRNQEQPPQKPETHIIFPYAHIEVLVTFLLVNIFGFWVIARYPTMRF